MYNYTLGTIFAFICASLIAYSTFCKDKKNMAKIQIFNPIFGVLSNFFFCSYSAVVSNTVNIIRNYLTYKDRITKLNTLVFIAFYVIFGLIFNSRGFIGLFPILASSSYAVFCFISKDSQLMRYGLVLNQILWLIHDAYLRIYPSMIVEILVSLITIYNIIKFKDKKQC